MKLGFLLGEAWAGIRSNLAMVFAIIIVSLVSFSFASIAALLQVQVSEMRSFWFDQSRVQVFLCTENSLAEVCPSGAVTPEQITAIKLQLDSPALQSYVERYEFFDSQAVYEQLISQLGASEITSYVFPQQLNQMFSVKLVSPQDSDLVLEALGGFAGVEVISDQSRYFDQIFAFFDFGSLLAAAVAAVMMFTAALLIFTTIRLSALARAREISIMRLVGASSLMIQVPFLLEGVLITSIGAALGGVATYFAVGYLVDAAVAADLELFVFIDQAAVWPIAGTMVALAALIATVASGASIQKFLRV